MKEITLVRHGDTEATEKGYFAGQSDIPLSKRGQERIALLRPEFQERSFQGIFVSPLSRTMETLALIASDQVPFESREDIVERSFGSWEGMNWDSVNQRFPDQIDQWISDPLSFTPPGGESFCEVRNRVNGFWNDLIARDEGHYLVVTHAGVIRCLLVQLTGMSFQATFHLLLDPGVQVGIRHTPDGTQIVSIRNTEVDP